MTRDQSFAIGDTKCLQRLCCIWHLWDASLPFALTWIQNPVVLLAKGCDLSGYEIIYVHLFLVIGTTNCLVITARELGSTKLNRISVNLCDDIAVETWVLDTELSYFYCVDFTGSSSVGFDKDYYLPWVQTVWGFCNLVYCQWTWAFPSQATGTRRLSQPTSFFVKRIKILLSLVTQVSNWTSY